MKHLSTNYSGGYCKNPSTTHHKSRIKNLLFLVYFLCIGSSFAQTKYFPIPGAIEIPGNRINGKLDDLSDFATRTQVPFTMPDGVKLMTDIYLPILQDSFVFKDTLKFQLLPAPFPPMAIPINATLLPKGFQFILYDSINGQVNQNPYQLPLILERTPYNKNGGDVTIGSAMSLLGYSAAVQDMRGRYTSQGVYMPLYSDSWKKSPYHAYKHVLDITPTSDPRNGNNHEDGYNTIEFIKNSLVRNYDLNGDGIFETVDKVYNGSIGTFGASALGYNQLQAASAHKIDPTQPGLKCLFPIVGPLEFYKSTGFHNGCFRQGLVAGWVGGQLIDTRDDQMAIDMSIDDDIHSSKDYNLPNKYVAIDKGIDHFVTIGYDGSPCGYYPNSLGRKDMDASQAPVDANGESDPNGTYSRYKNMEVPTFAVAGWWDIFVDGSIETHSLMRGNLTQKKNMQKLVIGPWAHQTIAQRTTGDKTYPKNIQDITRIDLNLSGDINIGDIAQSELIGWFRYNLNYHGYNTIGEPKILIPKQNTWQRPLPQSPDVEVRFPSKDYKIRFIDLLNFILGSDGLKQVPIEIRIGILTIPLTIDVPAIGSGLGGFGGGLSGRIDNMPVSDFANIPPVRFYVVGASSDDGNTSYAGNYWMSADTFPIQNVNWKSMFLHQNGKLDFNVPTTDEGYKTYINDPNDPIITVGGGNMLEQTPQGDRESQGQMNLADTKFANYTMDREGVIKFETDVLTDSLCVIGFPKVKLYAESNLINTISGPTDCDFFVRIVDVYPDGKEFFVVEGAVNARAREFARSIANGHQNDNATFSNINLGQIYEYYFECYPIAYTFAEGHKMKVLISSTNYPRFQSCANIPIMPNEFFRRKPADGKTYFYNGIEYAPRTTVQRIAFSNQYPTQIELPVFGRSNIITAIKNTNANKLDWNINLFPNPSQGKFSVFVSKNGTYNATVFNMLGEKLLVKQINDQSMIDVTSFAKGQYILEVTDTKNDEQKITKSFTIN